jgi:hypothetical protein
MHDLLIALSYVGILVLPIIVATRNIQRIGNDEPDSKPLRRGEILH